MPFDSLGRYTANFKSWDHIGNVIPVVEHSEGFRPQGEFRPAAWLPTQFFDKFYEDFFVIMPGKIIAEDNDGRLVPAQYGLTGATITYTTTDVGAGVTDVRTGAALLSNATGTFAVSGVTNFMGEGVTMAVSAPVGVAPYAFWQWAGTGAAGDDGNNPVFFRRHNYEIQHRVAMLCDYVLELPLVPATVSSAESLTKGSNSGNLTTFSALANLPVAANTVRTPFVFANGTASDVTTRFAVQVTALNQIVAAGQWFVNLTTGVITVWDPSNTVVTGGYTLVYSHYASAPTGSNVSKFACVLGNPAPGAFLKCNADSNWIVDSSPGLTNTMGQVLELEVVLGKDFLDRVRTAFPSLSTSALGGLPGFAGQLDQMPGSADGGVPDKVHYAGAADTVVRVNLITR